VRLRVPAALAAVALAATVPGGPAGGQSTGEGYDFYSLRALGDGVTADFNLVGFLPIEDLVGLSSITSEAHFGVGRSDALAALPDPGDLVLTLPSTLSALAGVSGLPDYPAAAQADFSSRPVDDVQLVPDAGLGAARLHTEATEEGSAATAFVGHQVDTIGLLPGFSIGSVRTTATARRINEANLEATATTEVSDLRLVGGLLRISQLTSEVTVGVSNGDLRATASKVDVSGVTLAGVPVGITAEGIVGLGQPLGLAPVVDTLLGPLLDQGIQVRVIPASEVVTDTMAVATGAALEIQAPLDVQGYPGTFSLTLGRATAALEVGPFGTGGDGGTSGEVPPPDDGGGEVALPDLGSSPSFGSDLPVVPVESGGAPAAPSGRSGPTTEIVSVALGRQVADWDVADLYRLMLLGGLALFVAGRVVVRTSLRPQRRATDLRQLWRW
jgi:hypothetical protein